MREVNIEPLVGFLSARCLRFPLVLLQICKRTRIKPQILKWFSGIKCLKHNHLNLNIWQNNHNTSKVWNLPDFLRPSNLHEALNLLLCPAPASFSPIISKTYWKGDFYPFSFTPGLWVLHLMRQMTFKGWCDSFRSNYSTLTPAAVGFQLPTCHCDAPTPKYLGRLGSMSCVALSRYFKWDHKENQLLGSTQTLIMYPADYWLGSTAQSRMEHVLQAVLQDCLGWD